MRELVPGIFHWTAIHPKIRIEVSSYYVEPAAALIDPMVPPDEGIQWFGERRPQRILLTNRHHYRESDRFREAFDLPVLCHESGLHEFEGGPSVEPYAVGDEVAPGIFVREVDAICPDDMALHVTHGNGALAFADSVIRYGELGFVPDEYMDEPPKVKEGVRAACRRLAGLDFDALLFAHGDPLASGGKDALRRFAG